MSGDQVALIVSVLATLAAAEYLAVAVLVFLDACFGDILERRHRDRLKRPNLAHFRKKFHFAADTDSDAADVLIELSEDVPLDRRSP